MANIKAANMQKSSGKAAPSGKKYVVRAMRAKCDQGTMENYLNVERGHGVLYDGQPILNANDHMESINLTPFGDCNSKSIYEEAQKEMQVQEGDGFLAAAGKTLLNLSGLGSLFMGISFLTSFFRKCEMSTPTPWLFENKDFMVDGAGALTVESQCACRYGGTISIVLELEEAPAEAPAEGDAAATPG